MAAFTYYPITIDAAGARSGMTWTPGTASCRVTAALNSDEIQDEVSFNNFLYGMNNVLAALSGGEVPMTTSTISAGTTVTIACSASLISINGVAAIVAAQTAQALGALGTIPAGTWGVIKYQRVLAGTASFVSGADNYTTGYATEALAIAAMPATTADRVAIGYVTILAPEGGFVVATTALGDATTTNYYSYEGAADTTGYSGVLQVANKAGTVLTTTAG